MKVEDAVNESITNYPSLYISNRRDYAQAKFDVLHHFFIVLGNGIEWAYTKDPKKGGYLTHPKYYRKNGWTRKYDLPYGKEKFPLDERFFKEDVYQIMTPSHEFKAFMNTGDYKSKKHLFASELHTLEGKTVEANSSPYDPEAVWVIDNLSAEDEWRKDLMKKERKPYPNFQKRYSCFWEIDPVLIQDDWRQEGILHLQHWLAYFKDDERIKGFDHQYPSAKMIKDQEEHILKHYTKVQGKVLEPDEFVAHIQKVYEWPDFDGSNYSDMVWYRFHKTRKEYIEFIEETLVHITV